MDSPVRRRSTHGKWLLLLLLCASVVVRCWNLLEPINGMHGFRQTQTAGLIRDYFSNGIDILHPTMITLGDPGIVVLEFPLYQLLAAVLYKIIVPHEAIARLLTIGCGVLSIYYVYRIMTRVFDRDAGLWSALFFSFAPLNMYFHRVPMPDALAVLLALIMMDTLMEGLIDRRGIPLVAGIVAGAAGFMMKSPYVAPAMLPVMYLCYREGGFRVFLRPAFISAVFIPFVFMILWQEHANAVNREHFNVNAYPFGELAAAVEVKLRPLNQWYFGTLEQRLDADVYRLLWRRIREEILPLSGFVLAACGIILDRRRRSAAFPLIWLTGYLAAMMVIFNLNVVHNYYQLPLVPPLAALAGLGAAKLFAGRRRVLAASVLFILVLSYGVQVAKGRNVIFGRDRFDYRIQAGKFIEKNTERGVMVATSLPSGDVWYPFVMYHANRRGFHLPHARINDGMLSYLRKQGIGYLAVLDRGRTQSLDLGLLRELPVIGLNRDVIIYDISRPDSNEQIIAEGGRLWIDKVNNVPASEIAEPYLVDADRPVVSLSGWAIDDGKRQALDDIIITIDGQPYQYANYGLERPDVAKYFGVSGYRNAGWNAAIGLKGIDPGDHELGFLLISGNEPDMLRPSKTLKIRLAEQPSL